MIIFVLRLCQTGISSKVKIHCQSCNYTLADTALNDYVRYVKSINMTNFFVHLFFRIFENNGIVNVFGMAPNRKFKLRKNCPKNNLLSDNARCSK